jgi:hypothetical protein
MALSSPTLSAGAPLRRALCVVLGYVYVCGWMHIHMYACMYACICVCISIYLSIYPYTYIHTNTHTFRRALYVPRAVWRHRRNTMNVTGPVRMQESATCPRVVRYVCACVYVCWCVCARVCVSFDTVIGLFWIL